MPFMAAYGFTASVVLLSILAMLHGLLEAVETPGSQAAVADAAPDADAGAAQGLSEAAGSAAAAIAALATTPLYDATGGRVTWAAAAAVMGALTGHGEVGVARSRGRRIRSMEPGCSESWKVAPATCTTARAIST